MEALLSRFGNDQNINEPLNALIPQTEETGWHFATWCLADALTTGQLSLWREQRESWFHLHPAPWSEETEKAYHSRFTDEIEGWLDQGDGSCILRGTELVELVKIAFGKGLAKVDCFVAMPNHIHVLFNPGSEVDTGLPLRVWKGMTTFWIKKYRTSLEEVWLPDYWSLPMRSEQQCLAMRDFILQNPEKAGLSKGEYLLGGE